MWNVANEKYGAFYDALPILLHLKSKSLHSLSQDLSLLRTQFILVARLLCLYRSSDLINLKRCASLLGCTPYIKIKRKGQKFPKWEKILSLPNFPQISPFHLLKAYVALTKDQAKAGGPVLLGLNPPFRPLTADAIGSVTKKALEKYGVDVKFFGAHSTRGAGVSLMKRLGLEGEQVCEIGKWKSVQAFTSHYQRLSSHEEFVPTRLARNCFKTAFRLFSRCSTA